MNKPSVLLIDDNEATNFLHGHVLKSTGQVGQVQAFTDAAEALKLLSATEAASPRLIFLDLNMPIMNGWDFIDTYQQLPAEKRGNTTIIVLTTSQNPDDEARALSLDVVKAFTHKPLNRKSLNAILAQHLMVA